jgi:hypothetical protein
LHRREQIDRVRARRFETGDHGARGLGDMTRQDLHRARSEGRGQGAALMPPLLAGAQQQPFTQQRAQDADAGSGATIIAGIVDEDVLDPRRPVHNDLPAAEHFAEDDFFVEDLRRKYADGVVAHRAGEAAQRRRLARSAVGLAD